MAAPLVQLVAPPSAESAELRKRLADLGFRCDPLAPETAASAGVAPEADLILVVQPPAGFPAAPSPFPAGLTAPAERVPVISIGTPGFRPAVPAADEVVPAGLPDDQLAARLHAWAGWGRLARQYRDAEAGLRQALDRDPLTGLPGHRAFMDRLESEAKRALRYEAPLGLVLADVAGMKKINDEMGHKAGDRLIREIATTLRHAVREIDVVARLEGDSFGTLLPETDAAGASRVATRLRHVFASQIFRGEAAGSGPQPLLRIQLHIGNAALRDEEIGGPRELLDAASRALDQDRRERAASARPD